MKMNVKKPIALSLIFFGLLLVKPQPARADFWGGDIPLLIQIVANTLQELAQLRSILGTGRDTLGLIRDINEGIREAMGIMRTQNRTMQPGALSQYQDTGEMLQAIQSIYGEAPATAEARRQNFTDQSVSEGMTIHNQAFAYADQVDPEAERIKDYARGVSPAGAGRLTAQSLGVLINVLNQVLRTNAAMLKIMSEDLALKNRDQKVGSDQFQMQYNGLSQAMQSSQSFREASKLDP
jgi:hypothetical protein